MKQWKILLYDDKGEVIQKRVATRLEGAAAIIIGESKLGQRLVVWPAFTNREKAEIVELAYRKGIFDVV